MAETIPGGRYQLADGRIVDANGNLLEEAPPTAPLEPTPTPDVDEEPTDPKTKTTKAKKR